MKIDFEQVVQTAQAQYRQELFAEAVAKEVERLRAHRPWWHRVFPFVIIIRRRK